MSNISQPVSARFLLYSVGGLEKVDFPSQSISVRDWPAFVPADLLLAWSEPASRGVYRTVRGFRDCCCFVSE